MHLKRLILRQFRNYADLDITFSKGINWIRGDNGQGKTNLLEAIHLLSTGRSFRANSLSELILFGHTFFYIEGHFEKEGLSQEIRIYFDENTRKVQYNQTIYPHLSSVLGIIPSILLSPDDICLISGAPLERRRFLDLYLAQMDPLYLFHLTRYFKAMKQRNLLLKNKSESTLSAWEKTMADAAAYLMIKRQEAITILNRASSEWMQVLSNKQDTFMMQYAPSSSFSKTEKDLPLHLSEVWKKNRAKELQWGVTQIGPHRDDIFLMLGEKKAKSFSSEGQKRSCLFSLRFAQCKEMSRLLGIFPLLAIDDFGIQLDSHRQDALHQHLSLFHQVFLTSPFPPIQKSENDSKHFYVKQGQITENG